MTRRLLIAPLLLLSSCTDLLGVEERILLADGGGGVSSAGGNGGGGAGAGAEGSGADGAGGSDPCEADPCSLGCVEFFTSEDHCGVCGGECADGETCRAGVCDRRLQGASGSYTMCARGDGGLACWGRNSYGQMGTGQVTNADNQPPSLVTSLPETEEALYAVSPITSTCAVTATERLFCFGSNRNGALGLGTESGPDDGANDPDCCHYIDSVEPMFPEPVRIRDVVGGGTWAYAEFKCALSDEAEVFCWGNDATTPVPMFVPATVQLVAGAFRACALTLDGEVWCWVSDPYYTNAVALGKPTRVPNLPPIRLLGHGEDTLFAVSYSNELFASGPAAEGLLGPSIPIDEKVYFPPVPVDSTFPAPIRQVTGTANAACVLLTDGNIHCWGKNGMQGDGTLGNGQVDPTPRQAALEDVVEIAASTHEFVARTADGQFYRWGNSRVLPELVLMPD